VTDPTPARKVVVLYPPSPEAAAKPCPARTTGPFLSSDATYMRCADVEGHDGPHYCHIEWTDAA
jgi:hypothetical protein